MSSALKIDTDVYCALETLAQSVVLFVSVAGAREEEQVKRE